jgi:hypothetical protein
VAPFFCEFFEVNLLILHMAVLVEALNMVPRSGIFQLDIHQIIGDVHGVYLEGTMFFRQKKAGDRTYLQIVENRWEDGKSRQRVVCTLGRLDELKASGQLDRLITSGAKFSDSMMVIETHSRG